MVAAETLTRRAKYAAAIADRAVRRLVARTGVPVTAPSVLNFWNGHYRLALYYDSARMVFKGRLALSGYELREAVILSRTLYGIARNGGSDMETWMQQAADEAHQKGLAREDADAILAHAVEWFRDNSQIVSEGTMTDVETTAEAPVERKPRRVRHKPARPVNDLSVPMVHIAEKTPLETYKRKLALAQLRDALACHQPVVKLCVAERLSKHTSYAELAKKFFLSIEEVGEIMTEMRKWCLKYTTYFDSDWYWLDEGQPRRLMDHV